MTLPRRIKTWLGNVCLVLMLLLCAAVGVEWVRSYFRLTFYESIGSMEYVTQHADWTEWVVGESEGRAYFISMQNKYPRLRADGSPSISCFRDVQLLIERRVWVVKLRPDQWRYWNDWDESTYVGYWFGDGALQYSNMTNIQAGSNAPSCSVGNVWVRAPNGSRIRIIIVAHAWLFLLFALYPAWRGWKAWRVRRQSRLGCCLRCGYDLRGSTHACPECGQAMTTPKVQA